MKKPVRNLIASGMLAATLLGGGIAISTQAATATAATTTTTPTTSSRTTAPTKADREEHRTERAAALAEALGLTTAQVSKAQDAARVVVDAKYPRPARPTAPTTSTKPTKPPEPTAAQKAERQARHDLFEQTFAEKLGVSTADLQAAQLTVEKAHLAAEVKAGHITQAQADARLKAIADGTAPMGGPGGPRGHGGHGGPGGPGRGPRPA